MIDIVLTDATIQISGDEHDLKKINKFQTYDDNSLCFSKGGYDITKLKHVPLMKNIKGRLVGFAGLTKEIILFCKNNNIKIENFEDKRTHFDFQTKEWTDDELKSFLPVHDYVEHQTRALKALLKTNKMIVCAPTSAGKSSIMSAWLKLTNLPTLIITDRATLGAQLAEDFREQGIDCGFCSGNGVRQGYCMVSTIQSVKKLDVSRFQMVLADEVHKHSSKTFQDFYASFGCPLKYGFSASPSNGNLLDFAKVRQQFGSIGIQIKVKELQDNGVMAKAKINLVKVDCPETFDYPSANDLGIVHNKVRNEVIKNIVEKHREEGYICILTKILEHGEELEKEIPGAVYLKGEDSLKRRLEIIKKFNEGEIPVLIGSSILNEGISISNMKVLIMASGGKAQTQTIQKIGRVLRITKEKREGIFYDFVDMNNKYLYKHSKQRLTLYKKEGYNDITLLDANLTKISP
jgi:superfamily II DNA or RNA helicase